MKDLARTYRLPQTTTPENLGGGWRCLLTFGNRVLLAGHFYNKGDRWYGAVYEFTTSDHSCEGEIRLTALPRLPFSHSSSTPASEGGSIATTSRGMSPVSA